ncbi:zinc ribbon domain-containing protein [Streptomyces finlayi]|uniref:zinc ribbon domain-containing protein n=1 Tax=Streptomyces finlayi TaxID=67296 RepID=UPI0021565DAA|nr:zinc ribbon domain-containing protein [Streptomyces finlayi]
MDVLDARKKTGKGRKVGSTVTKRLLTGIARCGNCGSGLASAIYQRSTPSYQRYGYYYLCRVAGGGCGKLSRSGPPVDDYVQEILLSHLKTQARDVTPAKPEGPELEAAKAKLRQIESDKVEARRLRASDELSLSEFAREVRRLEDKEQEVKELASLLSVTPARAGSVAARIVREWDSYTVDMRRAEIARSMEAVVISKAGKGGAQRGRFRPELLEIVWR